MEKILIAANAAQISINTVDFACYVAKLTHSRLTGVFCQHSSPAFSPASGKLRNAPLAEGPGGDIPVYGEQMPGSDNINLFQEACQNRGVNSNVHIDYGIPVAQLIKETRFADLLIIDPDLWFTAKEQGLPTDFVKQVLSRSECPIVVAPYSFDGIDEILFAYDGSASSVFAIKQFTCLFPQFASKRVTILEVIEKGKIIITQKDKVRELMEAHYSNVDFSLLKGKPGDELFSSLIGKKNAFLVIGAFGRNMLSEFFKKSTANLLLKAIDLPVFIAHH